MLVRDIEEKRVVSVVFHGGMFLAYRNAGHIVVSI
jgi:hypothetical protein